MDGVVRGVVTVVMGAMCLQSGCVRLGNLDLWTCCILQRGALRPGLVMTMMSVLRCRLTLDSGWCPLPSRQPVILGGDRISIRLAPLPTVLLLTRWRTDSDTDLMSWTRLRLL